MDQIQFSEIVKDYLSKDFPEFVTTIKFDDDGSFDCFLKNSSHLFSIWIATYNSEITIGIEDPNGNTNIHTHICIYNEDDFENGLKELAKIINDIKLGKLVLYKDSLEYNWSYFDDKILELEKIQVFNW